MWKGSSSGVVYRKQKASNIVNKITTRINAISYKAPVTFMTEGFHLFFIFQNNIQFDDIHHNVYCEHISKIIPASAYLSVPKIHGAKLTGGL